MLFDSARRVDTNKDRTVGPRSRAPGKRRPDKAALVADGNQKLRKVTKANEALRPQVAAADAFANPRLREAAYYADDNVLIFNMDVASAIEHLRQAGIIVNCIVTSPPFYGQRDYEVDGQIGLEDH